MNSIYFSKQFGIFLTAFLVLLVAFTASAWTGPTQSPPGGNVAAPVNVGSTDQVKNGGLSVNAFAAFGNSYFAGNVGIGISNPAQKLVVSGNSFLSGNLIVQNGNVGIGTATPTASLDLGGGNISMGYEQVQNVCSSATSCVATCTSGKQVLGGACQCSGAWADFNSSMSSTQYGCAINVVCPNLVVYATCANIQ